MDKLNQHGITKEEEEYMIKKLDTLIAAVEQIDEKFTAFEKKIDEKLTILEVRQNRIAAFIGVDMEDKKPILRPVVARLDVIEEKLSSRNTKLISAVLLLLIGGLITFGFTTWRRTVCIQVENRLESWRNL